MSFFLLRLKLRRNSVHNRAVFFGVDSTLVFCARFGHVLTLKRLTDEGRSRFVVRVAVRFHPSLPQVGSHVMRIAYVTGAI